MPPELVSSVVGELRGEGYDLPIDLEADISSIVDEFACSRSIESYCGKPGREKHLLAALQNGGDVHVLAEAMAPEFVVNWTRPCVPDGKRRSRDCETTPLMVFSKR